MLIVETKEELKKAKENKVKEFIVIGELAKKLDKAKKISKLSKFAVFALASSIGAGAVAAPFTGGISLGASLVMGAGATATVGVSSGVIIAAIATGGVVMVYALYKEYNVEIKKNKAGTMELKFKMK